MDVISRQAAIDELNVLCQEHRYRIPGKRETYSEYNEAWQDALDRAEGAICNLPSAQPEHTETHSCDCERTETHDLVSRRSALEAMDTWDKFGCDPDGKLIRYDKDNHYTPYVRYEDMVNAVKNLPSQPESHRAWYMHGYRDAQRWIPVTERLPESDERVLVYTVANEYHVWDAMPHRGEGYEWEDEEGLYHGLYEVEMWLPLPEQYKGGQE